MLSGLCQDLKVADDDLEEDEEALNIVFGGNAGAVWHSEVHVDVDTAIDLSNLTFSPVSTSVGSATLDALHVEVAIFVIFLCTINVIFFCK